MKKILILGALLTLAFSFAGVATADTIDDPLHGACNGSGGGACVDNGTNTPLGGSTTFGFTISPGPQTGDLVLDILVPNNYSVPSSFTVNFAATSTLAATLTQVSGVWTSGNLGTFLGISSSPANPIGAFLPSTQALDAGATGFFVFQGDVGTQLLLDASDAATAGGTFSAVGGLGSDLGAYIVGFCGSGCTSPWVATANSGALLVDGPPTSTPEPASMLLIGLGLAGVPFLRRKK